MGIALPILQDDQGSLGHSARKVSEGLPGLLVDLHVRPLHATIHCSQALGAGFLT